MENTFLNEEQFKDIFNSHIKIETYPKTIESLFSSRKLNRINYKPYYQRNYVWDDSKATYFIESILLGTEIPPLIFFKDGQQTEVIDGRQRFETIKRFLNGDFGLAKNGLTALYDLAKKDMRALQQESPHIHQAFLDAKVRIIEFELVNNPPSNPIVIDKLKKEIFARYNTGITPLTRSAIDNAFYDSDGLSSFFKSKLRKDESLRVDISSLFLRQVGDNDPEIETLMQFIRKSFVLFRFPIKYYASGKARTELVEKFYEHVYGSNENPEEIFRNFSSKVKLVNVVRQKMMEKKSTILPNRLFWECLLWAINVLEQEKISCDALTSDDLISHLVRLYENDPAAFDSTQSHYYLKILKRFNQFASFLEERFEAPILPYVMGDAEWKERVDEVRTVEIDAKTELEKLETLRITKPDPSRNSVEDIHRAMSRLRFLVRPSYQRSEVVNLMKASAIIESILLGIMLPAIFIYKRKDGISEVIDGQQRILTILGFVGEQYLDENRTLCYSKNNRFKLKDLRILKHLNGKGFADLDSELKDKIWEFELLVVEIEERLNPQFNPVDLFIRLNDKPYPIREHSFEMWNSWVDKDIIDLIKKIFNERKEWFYVQNVNREQFRDRMGNEELLTILAYFDYQLGQDKQISHFLDIHQKGERINARVKQKKNVTALLNEATEKAEVKAHFLFSINNVADFLDKIVILLDSRQGNQTDIKGKLDNLLASGSKRTYYQRTFQDIYILWSILNSFSPEILTLPETYVKVESLFRYMKKIPTDMIDNNLGLKHFVQRLYEIT